MKLTENQREWFVQRYCAWMDEQDYDLTKEEILVAFDSYFDDFQIGNEALLDAIFSKTHRQVALSLLAYLYVFKHDSLFFTNPVIQDFLAEHISVTGYMNSVKEYQTLGEGTRNALEDSADEMVVALQSIYNHEQIGAELGLEGKALGVYDAMRGFLADFHYRTLQASRELMAWLDDAEQEHTRDSLSGRIRSLCEKYMLHTNERLACNYIADEIMQWKGVTEEKLEDEA